jgi:SAM-dependent methyltransferase
MTDSTRPPSRTSLATSFGRETAAYNAGRPEYPAAAVRWMIEGPAPDPARTVADIADIADIGAGTGKLTAALSALLATRPAGAPSGSLVAVDPDAAMLASLSQRLPEVRTLVGTGEALPLPDASCDALAFGQAWHWVDEPVASRECARVLRPGGVLGLIWNVRDPDVPWVADLTEIMHASEAELHVARGGPHLGPEFSKPEIFVERWTRLMTVDEVLAMATSRSYLIAAPADERAQILASIRTHLAIHPAVAGREPIEMPYVTTVYRALKC